MSIRKNKLALAIAVAFALPASAFATNGIIQAGNGIVAHGMGGAGLANAGEASAGADNPALISQTGDSVNVGWSMFMPERKFSTTSAVGPAGTVQKSDSTLFGIPQAAFTSKISDSMNWGVMAYAMGGMNTDYREGLAPGMGQTTPQSINLQGIIVAPTMSYSFSPNLTAGASLLLGYEMLTANNLFGQGAPGTFEDTSTGEGVKLGLDYKISNGVSIGAIVQPKMHMAHEMNGFKQFLNGFGFTGKATLELPNEYGVGGKFALGSNADIVADVLYYDWNSVDVFKFFGWKSEPVFKVGTEIRPTDKWALRAGLNYGKSPIQGGARAGAGGSMDAAFANYVFPAISEWHITVGAGYKADEHMTINGYYLYAPNHSETATTSSMTSSGAFPAGTKISMYQNAFGLDMNYKF
ncbi:MAG: OmpP1/FadL family transporter [Acidiferrobacterales bacterium]